ncbi:hypothetical protein RUE5091_01441 [Ruegeria denitrificans]|uniref:Cbb3-type cytochrome oxidase, subunit 3 n=1 Tax=Ruegeria denitrificans TaxID=1715692 RepID=A0A0N7M947_9RHOB|nr:hypothetical protein [Ruegeria denitrificans]CUJ94635.1 hypothetical protein RUE5091_01441 [Ruegeria denitrificans]
MSGQFVDTILNVVVFAYIGFLIWLILTGFPRPPKPVETETKQVLKEKK